MFTDNKEYCPNVDCQACLQGDEIPVNSQPSYGATHFSIKIGVEVQGVYDGVLYWKCPVCGCAWHYWNKDDWRNTRAEQHVMAVNKQLRK